MRSARTPTTVRLTMSDPYTVMVRRRGDTAWIEPVADDRPLDYTCTVCATRGPWGDSWSWFGSYRDADRNPGRLPTFCTDMCRDQWGADNAHYVEQVGAAQPKRSRRKS